MRGYDEDAMMVTAEVLIGSQLAERLPVVLSDSRVAYVHIHNAGPGCFACRAVRA